jgi:hypothetical protein
LIWLGMITNKMAVQWALAANQKKLRTAWRAVEMDGPGELEQCDDMLKPFAFRDDPQSEMTNALK